MWRHGRVSSAATAHIAIQAGINSKYGERPLETCRDRQRSAKGWIMNQNAGMVA